jgi:hypothetical protein
VVLSPQPPRPRDRAPEPDPRRSGNAPARRRAAAELPARQLRVE